VKPEETYAVVVGIEKYALGNSDLNGPATDAVRFVEWLRGSHVPAKNIFLFLSPLKKNAATLNGILQSPAVGVASQPAGRDQIESCLRALDDAAKFTGELLYFFWGGHGIADRSRKRYLFYADTTEKTLEKHLDVPSWLGLLASYRHLPIQIGYIDACANLKPQWDVGQSTLPSRPINARQAISFAAAIGQRAANKELERSGKFSQIVTEALRSAQAADPAWPPSPPAVIEKIRQIFQEDLTQQPVFYALGDLEGNEWSGGRTPASEFVEAIARKNGFPVQDLREWADEAAASPVLGKQTARNEVLHWLKQQHGGAGKKIGPILSNAMEDWLRTISIAINFGRLGELSDHIDEMDILSIHLSQKMRMAHPLGRLEALIDEAKIPSEELHRACFQAAGPQHISSPHTSRCGEILRSLPQFMDDPFRSAAEFALRIYRKTKQDELRQWAEKYADFRTIEDINSRLDNEAADDQYYLFCWISKKHFTPILFRGRQFQYVTKWPRIELSPGLPYSELNEIVKQYLEEAEKYEPPKLCVHFFVSKEYFGWNPQSIFLNAPLGDPQPLGRSYLTVMRWRERALRQARTRYDEWLKRAQLLRDGAKDCKALSVCWISEDIKTADTPALFKTVGQDHHILAFDFVVPRTLERIGNPLPAAILEGLPLILWPCKDPNNPAAVRTAISDYAGSGDFRQFEEQMTRFYGENQQQWELTLFWDDPKYKPEKWEYADEL